MVDSTPTNDAAQALPTLWEIPMANPTLTLLRIRTVVRAAFDDLLDLYLRTQEAGLMSLRRFVIYALNWTIHERYRAKDKIQ